MRQNNTVIAIDPGVNGSIVHGTSLHDVQMVNMPETAHDTRDLIREILASGFHPMAYLEMVNGFGGNTAMTGHAGFTFGFNAGVCLATLACHDIPVVRPTPQKWQGLLRLPPNRHLSKAEHKNRLKAKAQELFAGQKVTLKNADALLIYFLATQGELLPF